MGIGRNRRSQIKGSAGVGDQTERYASIKATGNQNVAGGGRYGVDEMAKIVKEDSQKALKKRSQQLQPTFAKKLKDGDAVIMNPEVQSSQPTIQ